MTIHSMFRRLAPVAALAGAALVAACGGLDIEIGDGDGVPLAELDMQGAAPTEIVMAGPDKVVVSEGSELDITVSGDDRAIELLRFSLDDDSLTISRKNGNWRDTGTATVEVTMPSLTEIVLAGSGDIEAAALKGQAEVTIAGSGTTTVARVDAESLEMTIAGSGDFQAAGRTDSLELTIAGSGTADMAQLQVDTADISVAGSGDAEFSSDGTVDASIMGSGTITVNGRADCTVSAMGSGSLKCRNTRESSEDGAFETPEPPET